MKTPSGVFFDKNSLTLIFFRNSKIITTEQINYVRINIEKTRRIRNKVLHPLYSFDIIWKDLLVRALSKKQHKDFQTFNSALKTINSTNQILADMLNEIDKF